MKRLSAQIGITCFSVSAVAFYLPDAAVIALLIASAIASAVLLLIRRTRRTVWIPAVALTVAVGCCLNLGFTCLMVRPLQERYHDGYADVTATLTDEGYQSYSKYYYRLETESVDGEEVHFKLLLKTAAPIDIEPFDTIEFSAVMERTENRYYLAKGYYLTVDTFEQNFRVQKAQDKPLYAGVIDLRQALRASLDAYLPEDIAALCKAIFAGDRYALDQDTKDFFRYAGASYFVVVSGLHFSIICLLLYRLLRMKRLRLPRAIPVVVTFLIILLYMAVTGFQGSVVRSGIMMIMYILAEQFRRIGDPHSSLGLAGIVCIIVFTPYGAGDVGLILSFAATFAIITWSDPIYRKISFKKNADALPVRMVNAVLRVLSASLAANILVFPISVYLFRAFSMVTLLSSLLLYLPVEFILILCLLLCVFFYLGPLRYLSLLLSWPLYALCRLVLWVVEGLASLPYSYVTVGHDFFYLWMTVTVVLGIIVIGMRNHYRLLPIAAVLSALLLLIGTVTSAAVELNTTALTVYQCGDGLTVGLCQRGRMYLLAFQADSAEGRALSDALSGRCCGAELAVCSSKKEFNNYSRFSDREFAISHYLLYDDAVAYHGSAELIAYNADEQYDLGDGAMLAVAQSGGKLLSRLTVGELTMLIIPAGFPYQAIPEDWRRSDIIVLSKLCDGYEGLLCDTLIISHSVDTDMTMLQNRCRQIYDTLDGDVTVNLR